MLVDTHCHLDFKDFAADRTEVLQRTREVGVQQIVTIGIDLRSSRRAVALALTHPEVYATVGVHPHSASRLSPAEVQELMDLGRKPRVVAYGEIGLDFYRNYQPRSVQRSCLGEQLGLARQLNLPVVLHDREAHGDILQVLKSERGWERGGVMHCFSGDWSFARKCLDLDLYLSIAGPVTYRNASTLQDVARRCPLNRLLLETDSPFLTPVPKRGRRNEPSFLIHTAEKIALLRKLSLSDLGRQTSENAHRLFRLPVLNEETARDEK